MSAVPPSLASRFRGCMLGALVGDALGVPFEFRYPSIEAVRKRLDKIRDSYGSDGINKWIHHYSDDTQMAHCIAQSLLNNRGFVADHLGRLFASEYNRDGATRGYGGHVTHVFWAINAGKFPEGDIFQPAMGQFDGTGSWGNGGPMRIAPVALFFGSRCSTAECEQVMVDTVSGVTRLTHAHECAIHGAVLMSFAVLEALKVSTASPLDSSAFVKSLISKMRKVEGKPEESSTVDQQAIEAGWTRYSASREQTGDYSLKLMRLEKLLERGDEVPAEEVVEQLGNGGDTGAFSSVPPAIYSFLRASAPMKQLRNVNNPFLRTLLYIISLGGDADTTATMACALAGAAYGQDCIPDWLQKSCEGFETALQHADALYAWDQTSNSSGDNCDQITTF